MYSDITFTTAVALGAEPTPARGMFAWLSDTEEHDSLYGLFDTSKSDAKKFIDLITKHNVSPLRCEKGSPSRWESHLLDSGAYSIVLAFIALATQGAELPLDFDSTLTWRSSPETQKPIFFAEYKKRQESRRSQDTALKQLSTDTSTEDKISTYVEHAHYWLNLADAVINDVTYQTYHFALDVHIAAYFLHQTIKYYQHALYLDVSETLPKANDETAWAKPLGTLFNDDTRPFLKNELSSTWLQQYMRCLTELAQHDFFFHLKELHTQEEKLFAERLSCIPTTDPSSSATDSADDASSARTSPLPSPGQRRK
ncbi:MAG: hypothetical protein DHS20C10_05150 [marine bacterium B5-7]|nr:MAG: hypothetical protein DHS20C10_05150 [marine bacterium B5-7]